MAESPKTCPTCNTPLPAFAKKCRKCQVDKMKGRKNGTIPNKAKGG